MSGIVSRTESSGSIIFTPWAGCPLVTWYSSRGSRRAPGGGAGGEAGMPAPPRAAPEAPRRIADRLYGYRVSPVLWKRVLPGLSAGRVQSVATRIVVERERERMRFRAAGYWDLEAMLAAAAPGADTSAFPATLVA